MPSPDAGASSCRSPRAVGRAACPWPTSTASRSGPGCASTASTSSAAASAARGSTRPQASCPRCLSLQPERRDGERPGHRLLLHRRQPGVRPRHQAALRRGAGRPRGAGRAPPLRLVTTLVNVRIGDVRIGMPVRVVFHDIDGQTTLAFFEPSHERPGEPRARPGRGRRGRLLADRPVHRPQRRVAGRRGEQGGARRRRPHRRRPRRHRHVARPGHRACSRARRSPTCTGRSGCPTSATTRPWGPGPAQFAAVNGAIHAIVAGVADTVICIRAHLRQEQRFFVAGGGDARRATGELALRAPYGVPGRRPALRPVGPAPRPRVRHHRRAPGRGGAHLPGARPAQPPGGLARPSADHGRLPGLRRGGQPAADPRLRHAGRRGGGHHPDPGRPGGRAAQPARPHPQPRARHRARRSTPSTGRT